MRPSDLVLVVIWGFFSIWIWGSKTVHAQQASPKATPVSVPVPVTAPAPRIVSVPVSVPQAVAKPAAVAVRTGPPTCSDISASTDGIASTGTVKVPTTLDAQNSFKELTILKNINREFAADKVEKYVLDPRLDMASQARLLTEYRCFGTWKRQHEFYRKVLREHTCAYIRHRAASLLEFDLCNPDTVNALVAADGVIIPMQCEYLAMRGLQLLLRSIERVRLKLNPKLKITGILPTMFNARTTHSNEVLDETRRTFGDKVFDVVIKDSVRFKEAPFNMMSILDFAPNHEGAQAYRKLAEVIVNGS